MPSLLIDVSAQFASLSDSIERATKEFEKIPLGLKKALGAGIAAEFGREVIESFNKLIEKGKDWEAANNRIIGVLRATGSSAGITKRELEELAESFSKSTLADDDAVKGVSVTLLKFGNIQEDVFRRAVKSSLDLAGVMNNDFGAAAQVLGQALAAPELGLRALQREIGRLNPAQETTIRNFINLGELGKAQAEILKIVESRVSGLASQLNTGLTSSTTKAAQAYDDLAKAIARSPQFQGPVNAFFDGMIERLTKLREAVEHGNWLDRLANFPTSFPGIGQVPQALAGLAARRFGAKPPDAATAEDAAAGQSAQEFAAGAAARVKAEEERQALLLALAQKTAAARAAAARAGAQSELQAEKNLGEQRLQVLEIFNERGLISVRDNFAARRAIAVADINAEIAAIDKSVAAQRAAASALKEPAQQIEAQTAIQTELKKREELIKKLGATAVVNALNEIKANEDLRDELIRVNVEIAKLEGRTAAAAANEFELQNRTLRRRLAQPGNVATLDALGISDPQQALNRQKDLLVLGQQLNQQRVAGSAVLDTIAAKETEIEAARKSGAITDEEALRRTSAARAAQLDVLRNISEAYTEIARQEGSPAQIAAAEQFKARIADLAATVDLLGQRNRQVFEDGLTNFLDAAIGRTKKLGDAFKDLLTDLGRQLLHFQNQQLVQSFTRGSGVGAGGLFGLITKLFSGGGGSTDTALLANQAGLVGSFATGTDFVPRTGLALVHKGEQIIPAGDARSPVTINIDMALGLRPEVRDELNAQLPRLTRIITKAVQDDRNRSGDQR